MKTWCKIVPVLLGTLGWVVATSGQLPTAPTADSGAIQAIQQATDPSAAVTAFANGFAADRNNPKLYDAYVTRMVDLGLPELAYHQAEALTTLDAKNGLAWGVVGYVDARRGDMPGAFSAIILAGQYAPDKQFVQRSAGEILAWYDLKADKSQIADTTKSGLDGLRARFNTSATFSQAYDTAKNAYTSQTNVQQAPTTQQAAPTQAAQPQPYSAGTPVYGEPAYAEPPVYYSSYYYDWGPGWVAPAPAWWWFPCGFFAGFTFFPFSSAVVFDHHHDFDHHHHDHDFRFHDRFHDDQAFHHDFNNKAVWHRGANGQAFFGTPAQANIARVSRSTTVAGITTANSAFGSPAMRRNSMTTVHSADSPMAPTTVRPTAPTMVRPASPATARPTTPTTVRPAAPSMARPASPPAAQPMAPTMVRPMAPATVHPMVAPPMTRPAPSGGVAAPSQHAFASARPSGGGMRGGGGHNGGR